MDGWMDGWMDGHSQADSQGVRQKVGAQFYKYLSHLTHSGSKGDGLGDGDDIHQNQGPSKPHSCYFVGIPHS